MPPSLERQCNAPAASVHRDTLVDALQDLVLLVQRDGILLAHLGGCGVEWLRPSQSCYGKSLDVIWPNALADLTKQLIRRAIATRGTLEAELQDGERRCELQVTAQAPNRAICSIRASSVVTADDSSWVSEPAARPTLERRGFLRRLKHSISLAAVSEGPLSLAVIQVDGVVDISQALDSKVSEQVMSAATQRLTAVGSTATEPEPAWYMGQFAEHLLVLVLETADRDLVETFITRVCDSLRESITVGDAEFHLTTHAGVAIFGRDATSAKLLLEHARAAAAEARRSGHSRVNFFSETLKLRTLARLDVTRELRDAIANRDIRLRYVGRHDLTTGRLVALVSYLQWIDPMRGEVRPADFLRIAEATGLSTALSRSVLSCLEEDFVRFEAQIDGDVRLSFGALRHHVLSDSFLPDIKELLAKGVLKPQRLELRIAERSYLTRDVNVWRSLAHLGIRLVVDEFGRQVSSLDLLARVPLWGVQLDRSWVTAIDVDPVARRVCGAIVNVASALGLTPIATGIDSVARRDLLARLGCSQGLGDLYKNPVASSHPTQLPPSGGNTDWRAT